MTVKNNPPRDPAVGQAARQFVITRVFHAPRALVFQAWTDPKHMAQWWGPHRFTNSVCEIDLRPGGAYRIVMRSPDGAEYPMKGVYLEIVPPQRLVYTSDLSEHPDDWHDQVNPNRRNSKVLEITTTVTFEEQDGMTTQTVRMLMPTAAIRDAMVKMGMTQGWSQSFERLETLLATGAADRQIVTTRIFDAPPQLVFDAWTNPQHLPQWWGPNGFTTTIHEMDVRPGGAWQFIMHGPDGTDYKNSNVFIEVLRPRRLVYDHVSAPKHHVTVTFEDQDGKTKLTMRMVFPTAAERDRTVKTFGAIEGAKQTLGRLQEYLPKLSTGNESSEPELTITRIFDAPPTLVFQAWTETKHLERWQGAPQGFTVTSCTRDLRPGGAYRLCMRSPEGVDHWLQGVYREIAPPQRLVFTHVWLNAEMKPGKETLVTLTFSERGNKTELTLHQSGFKSVQSRDGHQGGWNSMLDRLAEYLAKA